MTEEDDVLHRCRSGKDCVSRTPDGPAATSGPNTLCNGCIGQLQMMLDELPHLADGLRTFKGGLKAADYSTSKVRSSKTPSSPLNVAIVDLVDEVDDLLKRVGGPGVRIENLIRRNGFEVLVWQQGKPVKRVLDGVEIALRIRTVHRKAGNAFGLNRVWQRRLMACPNCQLPTMGSWFGAGTVECTNTDCSTSLTLDEYDLMVIAKSRVNTRKKTT